MSSGTEKININLPGMTNQEIKSSLISIYDKINKPPTKEVGYDLFLKLVHKNIYSPPQMNFIINHVSEFITPLEPKEKDPCIKLLSLIFYSPSNEEESVDSKIYFPYLSPVLTTLQNLIKDSNSPIFPTIANIFAEIVQNIMPTDIEASNIELDQEEKTAYEMMQGFCIYNMKYDDKSNRIVGSLCLTKLVENCPVVLQKQYMKLIWEVIMNLIDKKNFNAKYELLNCLISLILGAENLFTPYAHNTLYKVLDFLADTDWLKRKLALNVIYTLIFYCKDEILPLKEHIINFLKVLKTDKVKEVREVCLLILQIFSQNEDNKEKKIENNYSEFSNQNNIDNRTNNNNSMRKTPNNIESDKKFLDKNKKNKSEFEIEKNRNKMQTNKRKKSIDEEKSNNINNVNNINTFNANNHNKFVNRNEDNTFINEKMKIRTDPSKSIFRTSPNSAFFNQVKNKNEDIIVMTKGEPIKYDYNENIEFQNDNKIKENKIQNNEKQIYNKPNKIENNKTNNENNTLKQQDKLKTKYKNEIKIKNINNKPKQKRDNINTNNTSNKKNQKFDSVMINKLLLQMNDLSVKQLSLIDVMENIQINATQKIKALNDKIFSLDSLVDDLTNELNELKSQNY